MDSPERVVVTGVGMINALGTSARVSFGRLCAGELGIQELQGFELPGLRSRFAAQVRDFPGLAGYARSDALAWVAAQEALLEAGLMQGGKLQPAAQQIGLSVGGTTGSLLETEADLLNGDAHGLERARRFLSHPLSCTAAALETLLGSVAVSATSCSACSSGALAIVRGAHWIEAGRTRVALVGGTDALCRMTLAGFGALGVVDPRPCRPFDAQRAGLSLGEGAGFLVLEAESSARARGAKILAWLSGFAVGAEAHHVTHPEPTGHRAAELMLKALCRAGLEPHHVDYVNAHGTGTQANDSMETRAIERAFGEAAQQVWISSSKGQLGHTLGAAGAIEAVISVLCLESASVPPSGGLVRPEHAGLRFVKDVATRCSPRVVLSNSFGFGGLDAVLCFSAEPQAGALRASRQRFSYITRCAQVPELCGAEPAPDQLLAAARGLGDAEDPFVGLDAERSRRFDRAAALLTRAAQRAQTAGAYAAEPRTSGANPDIARAGLVVGAAYGNVERSLRFLDRLQSAGPKGVAPAEFPHLVPSASAGSVSTYMGLTGPVFSVCDGTKSSLAALEGALSMLELGLTDEMWCAAASARDGVVRELFTSVVPRLELASGELGMLLELRTAHADEPTPTSALARIVHHAARSSEGPSDIRAWGTPPPGARVVLADLDGTLQRELDDSPWAAVERVLVLEAVGYCEPLGLLAIAHAARLVSQVGCVCLVLGGDRESAYWARLEPA